MVCCAQPSTIYQIPERETVSGSERVSSSSLWDTCCIIFPRFSNRCLIFRITFSHLMTLLRVLVAIRLAKLVLLRRPSPGLKCLGSFSVVTIGNGINLAYILE
ncbi:hypothetical protein EV421DRAFT_1081808 [Armillaria borealis]|uniref:Uncharacterized protein n=1 Tax=Armillaria borealis TaxID=47425 RepID=A0AA39IEH5_9AGAR|nr:hypothetical protein EV421DRAFT_1081808 [Armillaria borealis]